MRKSNIAASEAKERNTTALSLTSILNKRRWREVSRDHAAVKPIGASSHQRTDAAIATVATEEAEAGTTAPSATATATGGGATERGSRAFAEFTSCSISSRNAFGHKGRASAYWRNLTTCAARAGETATAVVATAAIASSSAARSTRRRAAQVSRWKSTGLSASSLRIDSIAIVRRRAAPCNFTKMRSPNQGAPCNESAASIAARAATTWGATAPRPIEEGTALTPVELEGGGICNIA